MVRAETRGLQHFQRSTELTLVGGSLEARMPEARVPDDGDNDEEEPELVVPVEQLTAELRAVVGAAFHQQIPASGHPI